MITSTPQVVERAQAVELPRPPEHPAPFRFPVIAAVAPVAVAVVIFAVTGSPFSLVFAALGPVTAVAGYLDSRLSARRLRRREGARFDADVAAAIGEIDRRHAGERTALYEVTPDPAQLVTHVGPDPHRWRSTGSSPILVAAGTGSVRSGLRVEPSTLIGAGALPETDRQLRELIARAVMLDAAPVVVDARLGIGLTGPRELCTAIARGLAVQLARALSPATHWRTSAPNPDECWFDDLPHDMVPRTVTGSFIEFGPKGESGAVAIVALGPTASSLPGACRIVMGIDESESRIVGHPDADQRRPVRPFPLSRVQAAQGAAGLARDAARQGITSPHARLPNAVGLATLLRPADHSDSRDLACEPAVAALAPSTTGPTTTGPVPTAPTTVGPLTLDLVRHGPHAVVGGTTGSGKSELLIAWVLAMAAARPPERVTFLLIDFKGGAAFTALARLPHTVGIITDLDASTAKRALDSLRAEVRYRERMMVDSGVRSIEELSSLPRLVIVVDEFAVMLADHPELHPLFSDLAARGRSLGIHLVLCTQRPAGVVREGVLANADLRVSLRVNNRADSSAVVGCDDAADIPLAARGRGLVKLADGPPREVQFALAAPADIDVVAERWAASPPPRRPWCEPLPTSMACAALGPTSSGPGFGLVDLPHQQRQEPAVHRPELHGSLLVLGSSGSGKSTTLRALARDRPGVRVIPAQLDAAWDAVAELVVGLDDYGFNDVVHHDVAHNDRAPSQGPGWAPGSGLDPTPIPGLVVLDDLDALVPRFAGEYRAAFVDALVRLLREGPGRGITAVVSAQRISGELQTLASVVPGRLLLPHSSRQEFVLAGGDGARYLQSLPPGRGLWRDHWVQVVADPSQLPVVPRAVVSTLSTSRGRAIVTNRVAALLARWPDAVALAEADPDLTSAARSGATIVGDPDEWQSRWGAIAGLRAHAEIVLDGCTPADFRALTRSRQLPPPLVAGQCWRLNADGSATRIRLDG
ncbi:MAG: FtsK/SpoIIIE domain-containing protein [Rhodoglobus sp.]